MKRLDEVPRDMTVRITGMDGEKRQFARFSAMGIIPECLARVIRNDRNQPMLIHLRDTMIAINRDDCTRIKVEGI